MEHSNSWETDTCSYSQEILHILRNLKAHYRVQNSTSFFFFYVFLALHPNIMIVFFYQFDAQILYFSTSITFLYMFRALLCSSSGGQLLTQHLVSSFFRWLFCTQGTRGGIVAPFRWLFSTHGTRGGIVAPFRWLFSTHGTRGGIVAPFRWLFSAQVTRGPDVTCVLNSHPKRVMIPDAVLIKLSSWRWTQ